MAKYAIDRRILQKEVQKMVDNKEVRVVTVWSADENGRKWKVSGALVPKEMLLRRTGGVKLGE